MYARMRTQAQAPNRIPYVVDRYLIGSDYVILKLDQSYVVPYLRRRTVVVAMGIGRWNRSAVTAPLQLRTLAQMREK